MQSNLQRVSTKTTMAPSRSSMCSVSFIKIKSFQISWQRTNLPLQAVRAGRVASFQEAGGGGPARRVLPRRRLIRLDPGLAAAERPVDGHQSGVAAAPDVEGHI